MARGRFLVLSSLLLTAHAFGLYGHITRDTTWSGTVLVTGDVVVDSGVTLTIIAGTNIIFDRPSQWEYDSSSGRGFFEIDYVLPAETDLTLAVMDIAGRKI